jgi:hypothetical protein
MLSHEEFYFSFVNGYGGGCSSGGGGNVVMVVVVVVAVVVVVVVVVDSKYNGDLCEFNLYICVVLFAPEFRIF